MIHPKVVFWHPQKKQYQPLMHRVRVILACSVNLHLMPVPVKLKASQASKYNS